MVSSVTELLAQALPLIWVLIFLPSSSLALRARERRLQYGQFGH